MKYLVVNNVSKSYRNNDHELRVLDNISFDIEKGDFISVIGPSGCGKTRLLRMMAGFEETTSGEISCNGEKITKPRMKYAYVFQEQDQILPWKTVKGNITFPLKLNGYGSKDSIEQKANELLTLVELEKYEKYYPYMLSGGMKQRVAIAKALAMLPEVLFMDEPFSALDGKIRGKLQEELRESIWKKLKLTIVFVTHNIDEAIYLSEKIIVLSNKPTYIIDIIRNDVKGQKRPGDEGYSALWNRLNDIIQETN